MKKRIQPIHVAFLCLFFLLPEAGGAASTGEHEQQEGGVTVKWTDGFRIEDARDEQLVYLRLRFAFQFRYTYFRFDHLVKENAHQDWSNFFLRRARIFVDGNAPNKDWMYLFHIQLEPAGKVNLHDAYVQWQRFSWCRFQFGRMKIPYGLEFMQSGFALNGVERTLFSGESDVDGKARDAFGNTIDGFWPGGNANFPAGGHILEGTLFPVGGLLLYRSQGINVNGEMLVPGLREESLLQYWIGVYNGRDTQGFNNATDRLLYSLRVAYAPLGKWDLAVQGDWICSARPKLVFLASFFTYTDVATKRYDLVDSTYVDARYDIRDRGFNLAALFRLQGFSVDLEYGCESYEMLGQEPENRGSYDRLGGRVNLGYFLVPGRWEIVFKWAYEERIHNNDRRASLFTGLGLVETKEGEAVEKNLQQYTAGINVYLRGNSQKICLDYSFLARDLSPANPGPSLETQKGHRVRIMYQQVF